MSIIALLAFVAAASASGHVEPLPKPLPLRCVTEKGPLCGTDGVTYHSINELTRAAKTKRLLDLNVSHYGPCVRNSLRDYKYSRDNTDKVAVLKRNKYKNLNYHPKRGININHVNLNNNNMVGKRGHRQIQIDINAHDENNINDNDDVHFDNAIENYDDEGSEIIQPNGDYFPNDSDGSDDSNVTDENNDENENNGDSNHNGWNGIINQLIKKKKKTIKQIDTENYDWFPHFNGDGGVKHHESDLEIIDYDMPFNIGTKQKRKESTKGTVITVNTNSGQGGCSNYEYVGSSSGKHLPLSISGYVNEV